MYRRFRSPPAHTSPPSLAVSRPHRYTHTAHSERANEGDMAHSPSGSRAAAPSTGDEAFTDAAAEDVGDSKLSALLFDVSQQVQGGLQNMLKMSSEIERCDGEIEAEVERARDAVAEKGRALDDDRERVQKAALAALDILSGGRGAV
ncbi:hypothetical protein BAE44_0018719 [Dichanthelium oligosanthes]|uniref:Polyamine-modulated factor 1-binding protein 1 n=1 Tax=Dichanthelium oligosanthes TaxID=888268 RepID=A0A1E5V578_9POAL|nr:hypothetical protein BAE44_0018719 [Dichanthelium oligosanthes]